MYVYVCIEEKKSLNLKINVYMYKEFKNIEKLKIINPLFVFLISSSFEPISPP